MPLRHLLQLLGPLLFLLGNLAQCRCMAIGKLLHHFVYP